MRNSHLNYIKYHDLDQGSMDRQVREPTGPRFSKFCWPWSGPGFEIFLGPRPGPGFETFDIIQG